jgi:maltooligosyltrehalose trehalohydrolase
VLDWNARDLPKAHRRVTLVQDLLSVRRREIVPRLAGARFGDAAVEGNGLLSAHWRMGDGASLQLLANLSDRIINFRTKMPGTKIWGGDLSDAISPWAVHWHIGQR